MTSRRRETTETETTETTETMTTETMTRAMMVDAHSRAVFSANADGYRWRKYGQKKHQRVETSAIVLSMHRARVSGEEEDGARGDERAMGGR